MKTVKFTLLVGIISLIASCGPTKEEIEKKENSIIDSLNNICNERIEKLETKYKEEIEKIKEYYENMVPNQISQKLRTIELESPLDYLTISYNLDYSVWSGQNFIEGYIWNKAKYAKYKDVKIKISYFSKTKSLIRTNYKTIYEYVYPSSKKSFKFKVSSPSGTKTIGLEVVEATPIYK